jgi:hypothetical protein
LFSAFDKINNFWQQKQQVLFLSNKTPKALPSGMVLLRDPLEEITRSFLKNTDIWSTQSKQGPHRAQEGRNFCGKKFFFNSKQ